MPRRSVSSVLFSRTTYARGRKARPSDLGLRRLGVRCAVRCCRDGALYATALPAGPRPALTDRRRARRLRVCVMLDNFRTASRSRCLWLGERQVNRPGRIAALLPDPDATGGTLEFAPKTTAQRKTPGQSQHQQPLAGPTHPQPRELSVSLSAGEPRSAGHGGASTCC